MDLEVFLVLAALSTSTGMRNVILLMGWSMSCEKQTGCSKVVCLLAACDDNDLHLMPANYSGFRK
jgi:hypothetical protein